jgi:hypothetical protein
MIRDAKRLVRAAGALAVFLASAIGLGAQADPNRVIEFDLNGLHYFTQSRGEVTVMFAHLPQQVREYSVIEVSVSNGTKAPFIIRPEDFRYRRADGSTSQAVAAGTVVGEFLQRGSRNDVIKLVSAYEAGLYGFQRGKATNGYEQRRQSAMADVGPSKFAAAAAASALVFIPMTLKPGESTDGAVFFPHEGKLLGRGQVVVRTPAGEFVFETMPPEVIP